MSYNWNTRTELLLGADRMERLAHSHVLVVGLGVWELMLPNRYAAPESAT